MLYDLDARLNATTAAQAAGVTKQTFNYWRRTGRITPDAAGTYRLGDVLEVERAMRNSLRSSRGAPRRRALAAA